MFFIEKQNDFNDKLTKNDKIMRFNNRKLCNFVV